MIKYNIPSPGSQTLSNKSYTSCSISHKNTINTIAVNIILPSERATVLQFFFLFSSLAALPNASFFAFSSASALALKSKAVVSRLSYLTYNLSYREYVDCKAIVQLTVNLNIESKFCLYTSLYFND